MTEVKTKPRVRIPALVRDKKEPLAVGQAIHIGKRIYRVSELRGDMVTLLSSDRPFVQIAMNRTFLEPNE